MNKRAIILALVIAGLVLIGGTLVYAYNQNSQKEVSTTTQKDVVATDAKMTKDDGANDSFTSTPGSYVTLADYNANPDKYADSKKVYFFHASWCHICQGIEKEITADSSRIPVGVTLIKTDFDNSTELRQKYGVTIQYTFVQADSDGNEVAQWNATDLDQAIQGIKS